MRSLVDEPESQPRRRFVAEVIVPGSVAGLFGGGLSGLLAILTAAVIGKDPWLPLKLLSGAIFRDTSLLDLHGWPIFWGAVLLLAISGGLGVGFALLLPRGGTAVTGLFLAALYGLATYLGLIELGLWADPLLEHELPDEALFPYILLLGCCLALVVPLRRLLRPLLRG